jgi:hypothetical protein
MYWRVGMKVTESRLDLVLKVFIVLAILGTLVGCVV